LSTSRNQSGIGETGLLDPLNTEETSCASSNDMLSYSRNPVKQKQTKHKKCCSCTCTIDSNGRSDDFPPFFSKFETQTSFCRVVVRREVAYEYLSSCCRLSIVVGPLWMSRCWCGCSDPFFCLHLRFDSLFRLDSKCKHTKHTRTLTKPVRIQTLIYLPKALSTLPL
jgi:hypothetical protein